MPPTESSPTNRDFKSELAAQFRSTKIEIVPPHQFYSSIVQFLAHGCPAAVLLDFFASHPDFLTLTRFMKRHPNSVVQHDITEYEKKRLASSEKIMAMRQLYTQYTSFKGVSPDLHN